MSCDIAFIPIKQIMDYHYVSEKINTKASNRYIYINGLRCL